ncbi:23S rRNA (guanosine(2251)-2'-O)-methyltransferase RlmB [bacterium]|nr:23S rRNA (guanosine(2251)-2'-O)-methyltransferase RlmB [bacterium]MBU1652661.1 23S rRNA (guanosine(2251)-2'-O)-methyltransferase RlmB [bacterium]MBU1880565.1 23S rRNA (guanosine(2251)-2'-O)-methyltransferase RlmB [bacterium]
MPRERKKIYDKKKSQRRDNQKRERIEDPLLKIPGRRAVQELLRRGSKPEYVQVVLRQRGQKEDALAAKCRAAGWNVQEVEKADLDTAAEDLPHQGFIAYLREFLYTSFDALLTSLEGNPAPLLIALDQVQDVGNLGAILRTAECAGVVGAILPRHQAAGITSAAVRRSAGAAFHLPVTRVNNLSNALDLLREKGFRVFGADQEATVPLYHTDLTGPLVLVVGSEGRGLRPGVKRRCDDLIAIPLLGKIDSLNASAAVAVCLYEAVRQRS